MTEKIQEYAMRSYLQDIYDDDKVDYQVYRRVYGAVSPKSLNTMKHPFWTTKVRDNVLLDGARRDVLTSIFEYIRSQPERIRDSSTMQFKYRELATVSDWETHVLNSGVGYPISSAASIYESVDDLAYEAVSLITNQERNKKIFTIKELRNRSVEAQKLLSGDLADIVNNNLKVNISDLNLSIASISPSSGDFIPITPHKESDDGYRQIDVIPQSQ